MGKIKYINEVRKFFKKNHVVNINSLKKFVFSEDYVYLLINNLMKKGEIKRITKGYYTIHEDPILAVFCFKPCYIGLQNALSVHDLWEQETNPVIITTKKIRQGRREILGSNVILRRMDSKYFFGFGYMKEGELYVPVSDIEKTFIDMIYFRQNLDKELLKSFRKKIDLNKLKKYLKKYDERVNVKVKKLIC